jgi:hypothetical protein
MSYCLAPTQVLKRFLFKIIFGLNLVHPGVFVDFIHIQGLGKLLGGN